MHVMNFLPADYTERRVRRRANLVCLILAGAGVLGLGIVSALAAKETLDVGSMRRVVEQQYREVGQQIEQLKKLEARKDGLVLKVKLSADLLERVPRSHVLARLTNALPPETSIQVLVMNTEEVEVPASEIQASAGNAQAPEATNSRSASKRKRAEKVYRREVRFRLDGLAKTDVEVAEYIARLTADPLFEEVNLRFSEEFPYAEGVLLRRFELTFRLSLDAAEVLLEPPALEPGAPAGLTEQARSQT
jgi:hypothetical protein